MGAVRDKEESRITPRFWPEQLEEWRSPSPRWEDWSEQVGGGGVALSASLAQVKPELHGDGRQVGGHADPPSAQGKSTGEPPRVDATQSPEASGDHQVPQTAER